MAEPGGRRRGRVTAVVALLMVLAVGYLAVDGWRARGDDLDRLRSERQAVDYLSPVTTLVRTLADARAAATAGRSVDQSAIRSAVAAVEAVDARHGDALGVRQRWSDLRRQLGEDWPGGTGRAAFVAAGDAVDRSADLLLAVGRASLSADPDPATRLLADAVVVQLPVLVSESGRLAALAALPADDRAVADLRVAAADRVGRAAAALDGSLRVALGTAPARTVDVGLLETVRLAAVDVAPTAPGLDPVPARGAEVLGVALARLGDVAVRLADAVGAGLDRSLADRESDVGRDRALAAVVAGLALVVALGVLWVRLPAEPVRAPAEELTPVVRGPVDDGPEPVAARLIDARMLLREVEVVRVGRAVQSVPRHRADGADELP